MKPTLGRIARNTHGGVFCRLRNLCRCRRSVRCLRVAADTFQSHLRLSRDTRFACANSRVDCHGERVDCGVDHGCRQRAASGIQHLAAHGLPGLGQFLEGQGRQLSCSLAHFATRLVGKRLAHTMDDIRPLPFGHAQGVANFGTDTGKSGHRKGHRLTGQIQASFGNGRQRIFQSDRFQHGRLTRIQRRKAASLRRISQRNESALRLLILIECDESHDAPLSGSGRSDCRCCRRPPHPGSSVCPGSDQPSPCRP